MTLALRPGNRLFVAVDLPDALCALLFAIGAGLAADLRGRAVPRENLHLTLEFLGNVPPHRGAALAGALRGALPGPGARVRAGPLVARPSRTRANLCAAELLEQGDVLAALHRRVRNAVAGALELPAGGRPLWPHVTIVRYRRPTRVPRQPLPDDERTFDVGRAALYDSHTSSDGPPRYEALLAVDLGPPTTETEH